MRFSARTYAWIALIFGIITFLLLLFIMDSIVVWGLLLLSAIAAGWSAVQAWRKSGSRLTKTISALEFGMVAGMVILFAVFISTPLQILLRFPVQDLAQMSARIEPSIRATFPTFCTETDARMLIEQFVAHPQAGRPELYWRVSCDPSPYPWQETFVIINLLSCEVRKPPITSAEWGQIYGVLLGDTTHLAVCP